MNKPQTLQEAIRYFSDEQTCIDVIAAIRWPNGVACPACEHKDHCYLKSQKRWKCKECHRQFSVKLGTIFEDSAIKLDKWLIALWMLVNCRNGVSSYEIHRAIGVTQKSAWFMLHRIRLAMREGNFQLGGAGKEVEADEAFIGGKAKNMHPGRRAKFRAARDANVQGDSRLIAKTAVMGILDREQRKVRATVIPQVNREVLQAEILNHVAHGSKIYTDEARLYRSLPPEKYTHEFVNHLEKYVDGRVHTNGLENFWSLLKRGLGGTYVAVEPFHLFRYVDEQAFRFNNRKDSKGDKLVDAERFEIALWQIAGKRLTFAEVTGKVGETAAN